MLMAGADAVEVGTATFREPRAPAQVLAGLTRWCRWHDVPRVRSLVAAVHQGAANAATAAGPFEPGPTETGLTETAPTETGPAAAEPTPSRSTEMTEDGRGR
jgi:hypothetical protein